MTVRMFFLAHGALGPYDELIYLGVAVIFVVMMIVSWFQTRMTEYDDDIAGETPVAPDDIEHTEDRFTLE
ncbi:MAG: hypothetical protein AAF125_06905 [Chloroflexota bacterium]